MEDKQVRLGKNGLHKLKFNIDETIENYYKRWWFISNISPKNISEFNEAVRLSNIWINMIVLKCKYNQNLEHLIFNIINSFKNNSNSLKVKLV
jgi:ribosomal protein S6